MARYIIIIVLLCIAAFCWFGDKIPRFNPKKQFLQMANNVEHNLNKGQKSKHKAKEYVVRINGYAKETFAQKAIREARQTYKKTGRSKAYASLTARALISAVIGLVIAIMMKSYFLAFILPVGCYFLPMWFSKFSLYRYETFLNDELETSLSIITTSYQRSENLIGAVEENLIHISEPVKTVFQRFVNNVRYIDPNIETQIEVMKGSLDNQIFQQWCDAVLLCQHNHNQIVNLTPIVHKFSALKEQQQTNKNRMMLPLRNAIIMIMFPVGLLPVLYFFRNEWYLNIVNTFFGQISLALTAVAVLITINKAINLSKPISFGV